MGDIERPSGSAPTAAFFLRKSSPIRTAMTIDLTARNALPLCDAA
jgi:hypothetical protein